MAVNLTALFPMRPFQASQARTTNAPAYDQALHAYFAGDLSTALEHTCEAVLSEAEGAPTSASFAAYRLWIELLADAKDHAALKDLAKHLLARAQAEPEHYLTYIGLRGLAHYEAEQFQAAQLLARTISDVVENSYCMELVQCVTGRLHAVNTPALTRLTQPLTDYCQLQSLARALLIAKEDEALAEVLGYVSKTFQASPLPALYEFHRCIDSGFYAAAALVAARLCQLQPAQMDYQYYHAYALFEDGDYPSARQILQHMVKVNGETDAESVGLLGHCYAKLGEPEKASHFLKRAISLLQDDGLPTSHMRLELANVEDELRGDQLDPALEMPRDTRMWLIKLSPRRYHELRASSESAVDRLLRPMGNVPRQGDFCFFAGEAAPAEDNSTQWQIAAIYTVDSEPMWHPVHHFHTALQLVARPPAGIPVAVQLLNDDATNAAAPKFAAHHPYRYGVYELEMGALDLITEAVKRRNDEALDRRASSRQSQRRGA